MWLAEVGSAAVLTALCIGASPSADPEALARSYVKAILELNQSHLKQPEAKDESELSKRLPQEAQKNLAKLLDVREEKLLADPLARCAEAALDLDRVDDFERICARLAEFAPEKTRELGLALSRPRFIARGLDGVEAEGLAAFADVADLVLDAYAEVFGFEAWSKVPGKKLRFRVHLVPKITRPPHFAPQFPHHSEVDFPVVDAKAFRSPTAAGQFLLYGLCHELGHVIAMWGDARTEEDHHSWAHYAGVVIVEHLAEKAEKALEEARDVRWRSLTKERERLAEGKIEPSLAEKDGVLALFVALHELAGSKAIGAAINALDVEDERLRINRVRYYGFKDFQRALRDAADPKLEKKIATLFAR